MAITLEISWGKVNQFYIKCVWDDKFENNKDFCEWLPKIGLKVSWMSWWKI